MKNTVRSRCKFRSEINVFKKKKKKVIISQSVASIYSLLVQLSESLIFGRFSAEFRILYTGKVGRHGPSKLFQTAGLLFWGYYYAFKEDLGHLFSKLH